MKSSFVFLLLWTVVLCEIQNNGQIDFKHIRSSTSEETQRIAVEGVIARLLPNRSHLFQVEIRKDLPLNTFQIIKNENDTVAIIRGSDGISACKGFHHYLKYHLNCHISWSGDQLDNFPNKLPTIFLEVTSPSRFIYHQNVCTWSYSFAWWTWKDWRRHIDWMAMMGISLTIAPIQEAIWTKVYHNLGLTEDEIDDHLAGPAFQAWQRMGNIRGWGGPLSKSYKNQQLTLQKQILQAQRNLGMIVATPAFAGHVPVAFKRLYPNATFASVNVWNRFPTKFCCPLFIDPTNSLFKIIGETFIREVVQEYGTDHIYFSDPFNEIEPHKTDSKYISETSLNIYQSMTAVDPNAIWLLQGWTFTNSLFWKNERIKSFLTAVPVGKILVLDLMSEQYPQYERTQSYFGQPFIWCMLHNFGGTLGMHGSINIINERISLARNMTNSTIIGVGITPEGINQNYILYEFALERGWSRDEFDLNDWFNYFTKVRYGQEDKEVQEAWSILRKSVYSYRGLVKLHGKYTISRRPGIKLSPWSWYDPLDIKAAWTKMLNSNQTLHNSTVFQHDLVDVTRQFLQDSGDQIYINIIQAFQNKNQSLLANLSDLMLELLTDLDKILGTSPNFLLGTWLETAKNLSENNLDQILNEINARNQITTWGPTGQIVDYATKQWSGIVADYFLPRWRLFLTELKTVLAKNGTYNENKFKRKVFKRIENPFNVDGKVYPTMPKGDTTAISWEIYKKWEAIENKEILTEAVPINVEDLTIDVAPNVIFRY